MKCISISWSRHILSLSILYHLSKSIFHEESKGNIKLIYMKTILRINGIKFTKYSFLLGFTVNSQSESEGLVFASTTSKYQILDNIDYSCTGTLFLFYNYVLKLSSLTCQKYYYYQASLECQR